ncbi:MAG: HAD family hydrolase [Clostridium sp.]|nr:HAD family hydrolase [Clostridium sp.]
MVKAVFLDFYGTVVHEDGEIVDKITQVIFETGRAENKKKIGAFWWNEFQTLCRNAHGADFVTQRELELRSLEKTIKEFRSTANAADLSEMMFAHWVKPPIFEESRSFFESCPVPVYIVSNIDTMDLRRALAYHALQPDGAFSSEDARSYKPRAELFRMALRSAGLYGGEAVHIGDSISSDVKGANACGIPSIWLNRSQKEIPVGVTAINNLLEAYDTEYLK